MAASVALVPFENLSGDPAQDVLARGFVEDIASALSRFGTLEVIYPRALATGGAARGQVDVSALATTMLRGSIRRAGPTIRITTQLLDSQGGRQLWADRFDVTAGNIFSVQDEIAERVASALVMGVERTRLAAAHRAPLSTLDTYDCWLRGFECLQRGTVEADAEARVFFQRALDTDPDFARAYAGLSLSYFNEWSCQAWYKWDDTERLAYEHAARAARLDDGDAMVQVVLGRILLYRHRFDEAAYHVNRALHLNPNDTDVLVHAGMCRAYLGDGESALDLARKAMRLNPAHPPWYTAPTALALFVLGRDADLLERGTQVPISMFVDVPAFLAASFALSGDVDRARTYLARFLQAFGWTPASSGSTSCVPDSSQPSSRSIMAPPEGGSHAIHRAITHRRQSNMSNVVRRTVRRSSSCTVSPTSGGRSNACCRCCRRTCARVRSRCEGTAIPAVRQLAIASPTCLPTCSPSWTRWGCRRRRSSGTRWERASHRASRSIVRRGSRPSS